MVLMSDRQLGAFSRRSVLRQVGALGVGAAVAGEAAAAPGLERRVVGTESTRAARRIRSRAERVVRELDFGDRGQAVVAEFPPEQEAELHVERAVRYVEPEAEVRLLGAASEAALEASTERQITPWGVDRIGATDLHAEGLVGRETHVAIIDTGIDSDHPDLKPNLGEGYATVACEDGCRREWDDDHDHGTHCAGIAGAAGNESGVVGVAPGTTLHAVKVISASGSGSASSIAEGLQWVADQGYDVASMSLGSTSPSEVIHDAVKYATDRGVLVVAAAGNEGPDEDELHYPAAYPEAIAVGAVDEDDDLADFSLTGDAVELVAPGVDVPSTVIGDYAAFSGTSMATPHVSGAVGLMRAAGYSRSETRRRFAATAQDLDMDEDEQGNGLLDLPAAVGDAGGEPPEGLAVAARGATEVSRTAATLNADLLSLGEYDAVTVGFDYWPAGAPDASETVTVGERAEPGVFSSTLSGLDRDTTYVFLPFAAAGEERATGRQSDFVTDPAPGAAPFTIETRAATDIEADEVELVGAVTDLDSGTEITCGFEYWVQGDREATTRRIEGDELDQADGFEADAEDLTPGTTYAFAALGTDSESEARGAERTVTTAGTAPGDGSFAIETGSATDIEADEAELVGYVTELDGVAEVRVGFEYWVQGERDATTRRLAADELDEPEAFDEDAENLAEGTTYEFVAYGTADDSTVRGEPRAFTTGGAGGGATALDVETGQPTDIEADEAELVGYVTEFAGYDEVAVGFRYWRKGDRNGSLRRLAADELDEPDAFEEDAENLADDTTYVAVAVAEAPDGSQVEGKPVEFTTASAE
jgi:subtilisin